LTSIGRSGILNGNGLRIIGGALDQGIGGSAAAAVFFHRTVFGNGPDSNNFLVASDGRIYVRHNTLGLLTADGYNGELKVLLSQTGTYGGDNGPVSAATARDIGQIAFDQFERVLVYDYDRIRRIDTSLATPTIETIIGG